MMSGLACGATPQENDFVPQQETLVKLGGKLSRQMIDSYTRAVGKPRCRPVVALGSSRSGETRLAMSGCAEQPFWLEL